MKKTARNKKETIIARVEESIIEAVVPVVEEQKKVKKFFRNKSFLVGTIVISIILIGAGGLYTFLYFQKDAKPTNAQLTSEQIQQLTDEVSRLVVLPEGEVPTIATVTDVDKLTSQPFFRTAQNGDKVLLFGSTKEAILYRPSIGKIIRMAPINQTDIASPSPSLAPQANTTGIPTVTPEVKKIKVAVLNSTKEAGLARKAGLLLDKTKYEIVATTNATGEYEATTVSKISGNTITDADLRSITAVMASVKAQIKTLPTDEVAPTGAEVVIVLGSDFAEKY